MNIFLDIDDVIFDWGAAYAQRFNLPIPKYWTNSKTKYKRLDILSKEREFWLNLPVKNKPDFIPAGYISARGISKEWSIDSLKKHYIPGTANLNHVPWGVSKINILKELKCDIFIDDKIATYEECHKAGIFCILMTSPVNARYKAKYRIDNLQLNNIKEIWQKSK